MSFLERIFGGGPSENLRIIITRHGERADLALGKQWASNLRKKGGRDPRIPSLTPRADYREWNYDPSLTVDGEQQSASMGKKLLHLGFPIDYCYSSPAYRSVQTANKILDSQGRKAVPISIEPGLFECPAWYSGKPLAFIPPQTLARDRKFNINTSYAPVYDSVDPTEDERRYYRRSRDLIRKIIETHKRQGGTVLLSGHGGSIEAVSRGLRGFRHRHGKAEHLIQEAVRVDYCNFAILERDARTREWIVRMPEAYHNPGGAELSMQSIIPLYGVSTEHITQPTLTRIPPPKHHHHHQQQQQRQHRSHRRQQPRYR